MEASVAASAIDMCWPLWRKDAAHIIAPIVVARTEDRDVGSQELGSRGNGKNLLATMEIRIRRGLEQYDDGGKHQCVDTKEDTGALR